MIFFKIILIFSSFFAVFLKKYQYQILAYTIANMSIVSILYLEKLYLFSSFFIITELLLLRIFVLSLSNSKNIKRASFKNFKTDNKIKLVLLFLILLSLEGVFIFKSMNISIDVLYEQINMDLSKFLLIFSTMFFILNLIKRKQND